MAAAADIRRTTASDVPCEDDVGMIAVVPDEWDSPIKTARHHFIAEIGRRLHTVWVDPSVGWRDYVRHPSDALRGGLQTVADSRLHVLPASVLAPRVFRPRRLAAILGSRRLRYAAQVLARHGCRLIVLAVWRPQFAAAPDLVPHDLLIYRVDDEYGHFASNAADQEMEYSLLRRADRVIVHSGALLESKRAFNANTSTIPNGVDFLAFSRPRAEPAELRGIPRPRVGYAGIVKRQLDFALLETLARRLPQASLVIVGATLALGEQWHVWHALRALPNVHYLGAKCVADLPAYLQHCDVGLLPYRLTNYTRYIYPLKLHEYLAAGIGVVSTPIPAVEEFASVVGIAEAGPDFVSEVEHKLRPEERAPERVQQRRAIAAAHDWAVLADAFVGTVIGDLRRRRPAAQARRTA